MGAVMMMGVREAVVNSRSQPNTDHVTATRLEKGGSGLNSFLLAIATGVCLDLARNVVTPSSTTTITDAQAASLSNALYTTVHGTTVLLTNIKTSCDSMVASGYTAYSDDITWVTTFLTGVHYPDMLAMDQAGAGVFASIKANYVSLLLAQGWLSTNLAYQGTVLGRINALLAAMLVYAGSYSAPSLQAVLDDASANGTPFDVNGVTTQFGLIKSLAYTS
jgi:hypothetical protein